jgi:peptide/nickel transport system substrate-binding protein
MNHAIVVLLIAITLVPAPVGILAQETGSGGLIKAGGVTNGPLNGLRCASTGCRRVTRLLTVPFIGVDPTTQYYAPGVEGALVKDWTISDDGMTYAFVLHDDRIWSDGEPIDGWDYLFAHQAYKHADEFESPYSYVVDDVEAVTVSDDGYTVTVTFSSAVCGVLSDAALDLVPSHVFGWTPEIGEDFDWPSLIDHPYETEPTVSGGPFVFQSRDSERIVLAANDNYYKPVVPEGIIFVSVPSEIVAAERFIAGELNILDIPPSAKIAEIRADDHLQTYTYPGNFWNFIGLNLADPDDPVDGVELDADGNPVFDENGLPIPVEQPSHPLFSDVRVRRAIQLALDQETILEKAVFGEGTMMASYAVPSSWAFDPDLEPVGYDPAAAVALLEEAGWTDTDGDGIRDNNGVQFSFELLYNSAHEGYSQMAELVQQYLAEIGIDVQIVGVDINQLLALIDAQTFDAVVLGWRGAFPDDPDWSPLFTASGDIVGSGFNFISYNNPEVDRLFQEARTVPGCRPEDRAPLYHDIQRILHDDQAYIWLFAQNGMYAARQNVSNWSPLPYNMFYQVEDWLIAE